MAAPPTKARRVATVQQGGSVALARPSAFPATQGRRNQALDQLSASHSTLAKVIVNDHHIELSPVREDILSTFPESDVEWPANLG